MYQATGEVALGEAARLWFGRTLAMREPGRGIAGYTAWYGDAEGTDSWGAEPGLLTGAAGIALALLAATTPVEPAWDRILLTSIRPRIAGDGRLQPEAGRDSGPQLSEPSENLGVRRFGEWQHHPRPNSSGPSHPHGADHP